jgi:hypothetical protein
VCRGVGKNQDVSGRLDRRDQVEPGALSGEAARITLTRSRAPRFRVSVTPGFFADSTRTCMVFPFAPSGGTRTSYFRR